MSGKRIISSVVIFLLLAGALAYASTLSSEVKFSSSFSFLKTTSEPLSILVVGDIMLDRNVRNKINEIGFDEFFKDIKDFLMAPDVTIGNLEGPFTSYPSKTASLVSKELVFTFDPALVPKLAEIGFDIFGLANNHTMNFGREGFAMTKQYLMDAGLTYYGDPNNKDGLSVIFEKKGITVGLVGFHEFTYVNFDKVLAEIDRIRPQVDFLIVSPHWGPEYQREPTEKMVALAHSWIDHGADAIIGAHPHVIGDVEEYNGKKIFYSLGNFVFDQYFSKETSEGLAVNIVLEKEGDKIKNNYILTRIAIGKTGVSISE
jgi:gamma-polyglutamate biosynthesis protein CapA